MPSASLYLLLSGRVDDFNEYRARNPDMELDYDGIQLSAGLDVSWVNLTGANLRGARLSGVDLRRADLGNTCLIDADVRGSDLSYADLRGARLYRTRIDHATVLEGARLPVDADTFPDTHDADAPYRFVQSVILLTEVCLNTAAMQLCLPPAFKLLPDQHRTVAHE